MRGGLRASKTAVNGYIDLETRMRDSCVFHMAGGVTNFHDRSAITSTRG